MKTSYLLRVDHWRLVGANWVLESYDVYYLQPAQVRRQRYLERQLIEVR